MKTLKEIFDIFVSKDELRPALMKPFEINEKIYATDAHVLIFIDKKDCDFEVKNENRPPNCETIIPAENTNIVLNIDKRELEKYRTEDEMEEYGEDIDCKTCNGDGTVEWEFESYTKEDDCPDCDGSGFSEEKQKRPTGNKTFSIAYIKIMDVYFRMNLFYKLIEVQENLGGAIVLISIAATKNAVLFQVGVCKILIMPVFISNKDNLHEPVIKIL